MNVYERRAWRELLALGAVESELSGQRWLDIRPIRIRSARTMSRFAWAFNEVAGRSGAVRRHVDRTGSPVFLVTDGPEPASGPPGAGC